MTDSLQLFDELPAPIEAALRASIERFGVLVPITVDQHGTVLDGHHRRRIAEEMRVPYDRLVRVCDNDDERREIARTLNADRRQLTEEQRREVVKALREQGHAQRAVAGTLGVGLGTVQRDEAQLTHAGQLNVPDRTRGLDGKVRPSRRTQVITRDDREQARAQAALEVVPDVAARRTLDTRRLERVAREETAARRRAEPVPAPAGTGDIQLRHGDLREVLDDLEGTVDAIITDPPYEREYYDLYEGLAYTARNLLRPNGVLAVMIGTQLEMLDNVDLLIGRHMRRRHRGVYLTPGQRWRNHLERVATGYKPILIYARPDATELRWINDDVFTASGSQADQRFHHWGQNEAGIADLVGRLTNPSELVVDPFLGGGTTAVVCRDLGRRFVGCDVDPAAVHTARERVA